MAILKLKLHKFPWRLKRKLYKLVDFLYLMRQSMFYNEQTSCIMAVETLFIPAVRLNDFVKQKYGLIFMMVVVFLGVSINLIYVCVILPDIYVHTPLLVPLYFLLGLWLLINATFNYFMGAFVGPGYPTVEAADIESVCKQCFMKKPPRTHHCRVCGRCVLKMDHHCPWINNCVGFENHRYFVLFIVYTCLGTLLICFSSNDLFVQIFYGDTLKLYPFPGSFFLLNLLYASFTTNPNVTLLQQSSSYDRLGLVETRHHQAVVYSYISTSGICITLIILMVGLVPLVSKGETTIEFLQNTKKRDRLKKKKQKISFSNLLFKNSKFKHPYHYGIQRNWQILLGIGEGTGRSTFNYRTFWRHILLPSTHRPQGDGVHWPSPPNTTNSEVLPL